MHEHSEFFASLRVDSRLTGLVGELFGRIRVVADGVMLINKAPHTDYQFPFHQDNANQFWRPPEAVAVTLALDDSDAASGGIAYLAGSHAEGLRPHRPSGVAGASRGLVDIPAPERYPEAVMALRRGEIGLHHVNTIHRTRPNRTNAHRRNLGFAYHSSQASRDEAAFTHYERDLRAASA